MAEPILNWGWWGVYKQAPEALTCKGFGDICKIIIIVMYFLLAIGGARASPPPPPPSCTVPE